MQQKVHNMAIVRKVLLVVLFLGVISAMPFDDQQDNSRVESSSIENIPEENLTRSKRHYGKYFVQI